MRRTLAALLISVSALAAGCSDAAPTATPVDPETVIELARQAMASTTFSIDRTTTWVIFNRATGERKTGSEVESIRWSDDGEFSSSTIFDDGSGPIRSERRCVDGQRFTYHEGFGWESSGSVVTWTPCAFDGVASVNTALADVAWTAEPQTVEVEGKMVLRMTGEKLEIGERDGEPDASSFTLTTLRLDVNPSTYRIIEIESVAKTYVGDDTWGIRPPAGEPLSTFTVATTFSDFGEPVVVEAPVELE